MGILMWFLLPVLFAGVLALVGVGGKKAKKAIDGKKDEKKEIEEKQVQEEARREDLERAVKDLARHDIKRGRNKAKNGGDKKEVSKETETVFSFLPHRYTAAKEKDTNVHPRFLLTKEDLVFIQERYPEAVNEVYAEEAGSHEIDTEFEILDQVRQAHIRRIAFEEQGKRDLADTARNALERELEELDAAPADENEVQEVRE